MWSWARGSYLPGKVRRGPRPSPISDLQLALELWASC